jgi:uncharacterized membrane protein YdjX (TVP38/TMEM64 family)
MSGKRLENVHAEDPELGGPLAQAKKSVWPRLVAVAALLFGFLVVAHITGLAERKPPELIAELRELMAAAGAWGVLLLSGTFLVGELLHIPGLVFVAVAVLSYGQLVGGTLGYLIAVLSVSFSFAVVRTVGGKAFGEMEIRWVKRALSKLDEHPIKTVALLRMVLTLAPPLNYALALSSVGFRDYLIGSAIGLAPPVALFVILFDQATRWLGWTGV